MKEEKREWLKTTNRFVGYLDIMGFKEMVLNNTHDFVLKTVTSVKDAREFAFDGLAAQIHAAGINTKRKVMDTYLKSFQFSDSLFVFSAGDTPNDLLNLLFQFRVFLGSSISQKIPFKGAISFGEITADFENSIFVGKPIIDAYLLHNDLYMFGAILDANTENKVEEFKQLKIYTEEFNQHIIKCETSIKTGVKDYYCLYWPFLVFPPNPPGTTKFYLNTFERFRFEKFYSGASGNAKKYVDNTLKFIDDLIELEKIKHPGIEEFQPPYIFHPTGE